MVSFDWLHHIGVTTDSTISSSEMRTMTVFTLTEEATTAETLEHTTRTHAPDPTAHLSTSEHTTQVHYTPSGISDVTHVDTTYDMTEITTNEPDEPNPDQS